MITKCEIGIGWWWKKRILKASWNVFQKVQKHPEMCFSDVELEDPWTRWCAGVLVYKNGKFTWPTSKILRSLCMCVYILPPWRLLPSARCPRHTLGHRSTILCCEYQMTALCQVRSSPYLKMSYFTSKDENSNRSITGENTIWYNTLREKIIYIDIGNKSARAKPTSYGKILKIRRLL